MLLLCAAGCGNVILDTSSGGAPGGGGGSSVQGAGGGGSAVVGAGVTASVGVGVTASVGVGVTASVGAGAGGAAGVGGSGVVTVSASSASSGGAGGSSPSCGATYFQLTVTDASGDMPVSLTSSCTGDTPPVSFPFALLVVGGVSNNPGTLTLEGCASPAAGSQGIVLTLPGANAPGTYALGSGSLTYTDTNGVTYSTVLGGTLVISDFQPPGGVVVGTFQTKVADTEGQPLEAKFAVCRLPDVDAS
jgi:hypothetical protein